MHGSQHIEEDAKRCEDLIREPFPQKSGEALNGEGVRGAGGAQSIQTSP